MEYRQIKDQEVSLLGFGCMRFPLNEDMMIDEAASFNLLDEAFNNGVNYYDTAYPYHEGESELVLGRWLKSKVREQVKIATKLPIWKVEVVEDVMRFFNEQLTKLQVDYVDYYLLHSMDDQKWNKALNLQIMDILGSLKAEGKIKYLGFSFHDDYPIFEKILRGYPWDFCQVQFNYMDMIEQAGEAGIALADDLGVKVVVMEPLKGGMLAKLPDDEHRMFDSRSSDASFGLRFVAGYPNVSIILSGMHSLNDVQDNLGTLSTFIALDELEARAVTMVANSLREKIAVPCTKCKYCMPCPVGVDIPENFRCLNDKYRYQKYQIANRSYHFISADARADKCIKCGACLSKCPQHIDIPSQLAIVASEFE